MPARTWCRWCAVDNDSFPDAVDLFAAGYEGAYLGERDRWLESLSNWSLTRPWAWGALLAILRGHRERGELVPPLLEEWSQQVALGERKEPGRGKGKARTDITRHLRMEALLAFYKSRGTNLTEARDRVAKEFQELGSGGEAVRRALERYRADRPF